MARLRIHIIGIKNMQAIAKLFHSLYLPIEHSVHITICNHGDPGDYDMLVCENVEVFDTGNLGVSAGWNYGIQLARLDKECDAIAFIPNDSFFDPKSFSKGVEFFFKQKEMTVVSFPHRVNGKYHPHAFHTDSAIYPMNLFNKIGLFDEGFKVCWYEDTDFLFRIRNAGISTITCIDAILNNFPGGNRSIVIKEGIFTTNDLLEIRLMNFLYFAHKWRGKIPNKMLRHERNKMVSNMASLVIYYKQWIVDNG